MLALPLILIAHVAVAYVRGRKAGISIVDEVYSASHLLSHHESTHSIPKARFTAENQKTPQRCELFALLLALGAIHGKLKRGTELQKVVVYCKSPSVVQIVHRHRPNSHLDEIISPNDRSMVKRVLGNIRRVSKYCEVEILFSNPDDKTAQRAMALARRKIPRGERRHIVRSY